MRREGRRVRSVAIWRDWLLRLPLCFCSGSCLSLEQELDSETGSNGFDFPLVLGQQAPNMKCSCRTIKQQSKGPAFPFLRGLKKGQRSGAQVYPFNS